MAMYSTSYLMSESTLLALKDRAVARFFYTSNPAEKSSRCLRHTENLQLIALPAVTTQVLCEPQAGLSFSEKTGAGTASIKHQNMTALGYY